MSITLNANSIHIKEIIRMDLENHDSIIWYLQETHFKYNFTGRLNFFFFKIDRHEATNKHIAGVVILSK